MKARPVQNVAAKQALACGTLSCGDCLRQPVAITSFVLFIGKLLFYTENRRITAETDSTQREASVPVKLFKSNHSKSNSGLQLNCARRDKVRSAERRQKVIKRFFVRQIQDVETYIEFVIIAP